MNRHTGKPYEPIEMYDIGCKMYLENSRVARENKASIEMTEAIAEASQEHIGMICDFSDVNAEKYGRKQMKTGEDADPYGLRRQHAYQAEVMACRKFYYGLARQNKKMCKKALDDAIEANLEIMDEAECEANGLCYMDECRKVQDKYSDKTQLMDTMTGCGWFDMRFAGKKFYKVFPERLEYSFYDEYFPNGSEEFRQRHTRK